MLERASSSETPAPQRRRVARKARKARCPRSVSPNTASPVCRSLPAGAMSPVRSATSHAGRARDSSRLKCQQTNSSRVGRPLTSSSSSYSRSRVRSPGVAAVGISIAGACGGGGSYPRTRPGSRSQDQSAQLLSVSRPRNGDAPQTARPVAHGQRFAAHRDSPGREAPVDASGRLLPGGGASSPAQSGRRNRERRRRPTL